MKTEDYKIGDRVYNIGAHSITGYGTVVEKGIILRVKWDKLDYSKTKPLGIESTPENGLTIRLADPYIREEKLNELGII